MKTLETFLLYGLFIGLCGGIRTKKLGILVQDCPTSKSTEHLVTIPIEESPDTTSTKSPEQAGQTNCSQTDNIEQNFIDELNSVGQEQGPLGQEANESDKANQKTITIMREHQSPQDMAEDRFIAALSSHKKTTMLQQELTRLLALRHNLRNKLRGVGKEACFFFGRSVMLSKVQAHSTRLNKLNNKVVERNVKLEEVRSELDKKWKSNQQQIHTVLKQALELESQVSGEMKKLYNELGADSTDLKKKVELLLKVSNEIWTRLIKLQTALSAANQQAKQSGSSVQVFDHALGKIQSADAKIARIGKKGKRRSAHGKRGRKLRQPRKPAACAGRRSAKNLGKLQKDMDYWVRKAIDDLQHNQ